MINHQIKFEQIRENINKYIIIDFDGFVKRFKNPQIIIFIISI
jgi:hypothetical protein